jgi:DNA-binding NtrC family response regulator
MARVLIVDDDPQLRKLLNLVLRGAGHDVHTAVDAREALDLCNSSATYDLVLSEIATSDMDGHELARWIAKNRAVCKVALMSSVGTACAECPYGSGCKIVRKPFAVKDVVAVVEQILAEPQPSLTGEPPVCCSH